MAQEGPRSRFCRRNFRPGGRDFGGCSCCFFSAKREGEKAGSDGGAGGGGGRRGGMQSSSRGSRQRRGPPASPSCSRGSAAREEEEEEEEAVWLAPGRMRMGFQWVPGGGRRGAGWGGVGRVAVGFGLARSKATPPPWAGRTYLPAPTTCPRSPSPASQGSPTPPRAPASGPGRAASRPIAPPCSPSPRGDGLGSGQRRGEASSKRAPVPPQHPSPCQACPVPRPAREGAMPEQSIPAGAIGSSEGGGPAPAPPAPRGSPQARGHLSTGGYNLMSPRSERGSEAERLVWGWEGVSDGPGGLRAAPALGERAWHRPAGGTEGAWAGETRAERIGRGKKPTGSVSLAIFYSNQLARRDPALPCAHRYPGVHPMAPGCSPPRSPRLAPITPLRTPRAPGLGGEPGGRTWVPTPW